MKIEIGKMYQNKNKRNSFVIVAKHIDNNIEYQFEDGIGNITTDTISESEFIENYTPQRNRNFILCFTYNTKKGGVMTGQKTFQTYDSSYLSYAQANKIIKAKYKDIKSDIIVTNIIELNDNDYIDFIS